MVDSTVMGPGGRSIPEESMRFDILSPPRLTSDTDMFKWRKQVGLWMTTVKMYAKGGDKRAKGMLSALGITLFNALDDVYSSQIEQAIAAGSINLEASDEDIMNPANQIKTVEDIIELVAQDSPTDGIRRLVRMLREVFACIRKEGETPSIFARRFRSIALDYINQCNSGASQQDSQNFAMLLLENSKLPADVYSSVVTRLVALVTQRANTPGNKIYVISKERLDAIRSEANNMRNFQDRTSIEDCRKYAEAIIATTDDTIVANQVQEKNDRSIFKVRLEDAVFVLSDLKIPFPIENNVQQTLINDVKRLSTMLGKRNFQDSDRNSYAKKQKHTTIPSGQGPKANTRCRQCKQPNHWYKDPECIYNVIKELMQGREIHADVIEKLSPELRNVFKDENGKLKTKASISDVVGAIGDSVNKPGQSSDQQKDRNSYFR